jgi:hypothetical protein
LGDTRESSDSISKRRADLINIIVSTTIEIGVKFFGIDKSKFFDKERVIESCARLFIEKCYGRVKGEEALDFSPSPSFNLFKYIREQLSEYYSPEKLNESSKQITIRLPSGVEIVYWKEDFPDSLPAEILLGIDDEISFYYWGEDFAKETWTYSYLKDQK